MNFREPRKITDLAEFADDYVEFMRAVPENSACDALVGYAASYFNDVAVSKAQLRILVLMFVDRIYRHAASLTIKDTALRHYYGTVTRFVLDVAAARGVRIFYILDNEIREDRFELATELFFLAGVFVVTPYRVDGTSIPFSDVRRAIDIELVAGRHIAYIEKDSSVNYLDPVIEVARATDRYAVLRNEAPSNPNVRLLSSDKNN